jgi:ribosomal protein S18 acetylase RimI-like enzyme
MGRTQRNQKRFMMIDIQEHLTSTRRTGEITNRRASLPDTVLRRANRKDAELLVELGKRAFYEAFAEQTAPEDMTAYLQTTFSIEETKTQLNNKDSLYLIIEFQDDSVGYAYLYPTRPPQCIEDPKSIQLIRFYLLRKCYGLGVGDALMQTCLDHSGARGYRSIWLSSWELNDRANAFYRRWHFKVVGRQKFVVGSDVQNDFIFMRSLHGYR